jgi:hypothetical protein
MLIRVRGKVVETVHIGSRNRNILIDDDNGFRLYLAISNKNELIDEIVEGKKLDLICNLKTISKQKGDNIHYENLIFVEDKTEVIMNQGGDNIGD